jgi:hypothetical protein
MPKKDKPKSKNSSIIVRLSSDDRDEFIDLCKALDTSASREIRAYIKKFVSKNKRKGKS